MFLEDNELPKYRHALELALMELHTRANNTDPIYSREALTDINYDRQWISTQIARIAAHQKKVKQQTKQEQLELVLDIEGVPV